MIYVGLDIAEKLGLSFFNTINDKFLFTTEIKEKNPVIQLNKILNIFDENHIKFNNSQIYFEKFVYLNGGAKAIVPLISRYGYIYYSLSKLNFSLHEINLSSARKIIPNVKGKKKKQVVLEHFQNFSEDKLTDNHTDSICLYYNEIVDYNFRIYLL